MIFKPRIFISSTLNENLSIRAKLENYFTSVGAEAMLYEKNLTPSIDAMTYRKDILDADFIIFIIKNQYGQRTEAGISGTHEELQIALETNIPKHVYIKLDQDKNDAAELVDEINDNQISYYYFKNDNDLFKRIKQTTFTIAKEIMLQKVENSQLPKSTVKKISGKYDYDKAIEIIKIVEAMIKINKMTSFDFIESNLFVRLIEPLIMYKKEQQSIFINERIEGLFNEMVLAYQEFSEHANDYTSIPNSHRYIKVPVLGQVIVSSCSVSQYPKFTTNQYLEILNKFFDKYYDFKKFIGNMKLTIDTII